MKQITDIYFYKPFTKVFILISIILMVTACADNSLNDLNQFVSDTKQKYLGKVEALPAIMPYESYHYQTSEKRDPFKPSVSLIKSIALTRASNGIKPNTVRNKEDLEKYALETLIMVGVMNNNGQNWAIVKAPDSNIFRVKKGNYMGENNGKILRISESQIDLKEIISDGMNGWIERKNKLAISVE